MTRVLFLFIFCFCTTLSAPGRAQEQGPPPVVIEFFGSSLCSDDFPAQEIAREIAESTDDVIFVNCRMQTLNKNGRRDPFSRKFCDEQRKWYYNRILPFSFRTPQIFVNGRYETSSAYLLAAVKMARSLDKTERIDLSYADGALDISIPAVKSDVAGGDIVLYAYTHSRYGRFAFINERSAVQVAALDYPVVPDKAPAQTDMNEKVMPVHYRPVVAMRTIGRWTGAPVRFSYATDDLLSFAGKHPGNLSYVVLLHETDAYGPILAAGELKAEDIPAGVPDRVQAPPFSRPSRAQDQP